MFVCKRRINNEGGHCVHFIFPDDSRDAGFCTLQGEYRCIDNIAAKVPRLSHSAVQDWLTCRRLFFLKDIKGIIRKPGQISIPMKRGTLWDVCQGKLYGVHGDDKIIKTIDEYEIEEVDRAVVKAIFMAFRALGLKTETEDCEMQQRFVFSSKMKDLYSWTGDDAFEFLITGVYDRKYPKYFVENKLSGSPDFYFDTFWLTSQIGTYFLSDPSLEYCIMEVVRAPGLKRKDDEPIITYRDRIYQDIMDRPNWYFIGLNKKTKTYGRKFFRNEFKLDNLALRYRNIAFEVMDAIERDAFYCNEKMCRFPWTCDMFEVCQSGVMSEELYTFKTKQAEFVASEIGD